MSLRALIVEDNTLNMELMEELLLAKGWKVDKAFNVDEAKEILKQGYPHIIFLDIQLPGQDGLSFGSQLREEKGGHLPPLVAVTAHAMVGDEEKILAAGFDYYLPKPLDFTMFNKILETTSKQHA